LTVASGPSYTSSGSGSNYTVIITWTTSVAGSSWAEVGQRNGAAGVYTLAGSPFGAGAGVNHSVTLTGLKNGTYHYRIKMQDACGVTSYSSDYTFNP
jgi:hypothetical protein